MKLRLLAALFVLLGFVNCAHAQSTPVVLSGGCGTATYSHNPPYFTVDNSGKLCVNATVSASVSGFTPGGAFATLTATGSSASVALPAGTTVAFQNTGTTTVSCTLGVGSATATANEIQVPASSTVFVTPGSNTFGACIDQTGSTSNLIVLAGGSGLGTGFGGGSSSGGGTVAQGNAGSNAQAWWAQIGDTARGPAKVQAGNSAATTDVALTVADPNVLAAVVAPPTLGSASNGLSVKTLAGLTNTAGGTAVKASAGQVYKGQCYNPDATNSAVLEFFNTASVTLGTTTVFDFVEIGPGSNTGFTLSLVGVQYSTAITVAAVKTIGSSTAPTTAIDCTVYFN